MIPPEALMTVLPTPPLSILTLNSPVQEQTSATDPMVAGCRSLGFIHVSMMIVMMASNFNGFDGIILFLS